MLAFCAAEGGGSAAYPACPAVTLLNRICQGPTVKRRVPSLSACPAVTFEGTAGAQNLAGYAEQVELKFEFGSARRSEYAVVVRRPRLGGSDVQGEVQVLQQQRSFQ